MRKRLLTTRIGWIKILGSYRPPLTLYNIWNNTCKTSCNKCNKRKKLVFVHISSLFSSSFAFFHFSLSIPFLPFTFPSLPFPLPSFPFPLPSFLLFHSLLSDIPFECSEKWFVFGNKIKTSLFQT